MQIHTSGTEMRQQLQAWRLQGERIALVPTMGNLHAGHLQLVQRAKASAERVVVSIFVNPLQFEPGSDYAEYPRTLQADQQQLQQRGVDLLFVPTVEALYPNGLAGLAQLTKVVVPELSDILCGEFRPGHFVGVTTVVCKLLNWVQPDVAVFGQKDYQQLLLIRKMVADLNLPVHILSEPIVREADGLAMSSRNQYLSAEQRPVAAQIYAELSRLVAQLPADWMNQAAHLQQARHHLQQAGFQLDYCELREAQTLQPLTASCRQGIVLIAARLGRTRLIDNQIVVI